MFHALVLSVLAQCGPSRHHAPPPEGPPPRSTSRLNTICPVLGEPVNERSRRLTYRGRAYAVCCIDCSEKFQDDPEAYLDRDGNPSNAKRVPGNPNNPSGHESHGEHQH